MSRRLPGSSPLEKLMLNHDVAGECWRWTGAHISTGYGHLRVGGKQRSVHRLAYELMIGPIPDGLDVDHLCGTRDCINPEHLEAVTHHENLMRSRGVTAINASRTHCPAGHPYDAANTIHDSHGRQCRTCKNARHAEYKRQRRTAS